MKLTKRQLRKIISEAISDINEMNIDPPNAGYTSNYASGKQGNISASEDETVSVDYDPTEDIARQSYTQLIVRDNKAAIDILMNNTNELKRLLLQDMPSVRNILRKYILSKKDKS